MGGFLSHLKPEQNSEILQASCGPIRGNVYRHDTKLVDGYLGIPYAQPPIGNLRYKKPEPMEKWAEPLDCYQYGPGCPQSGDFATMFPLEQLGVEFKEDNCLTLNVFAPRAGKGLPVMVYIHGGGFEVGWSSTINDYSLTGTLPLKDVVVVTINYRVGPLGFLTIDDVAKENYGLWDQTLALRWVQQHIHSFGGDNHNVTIFGTSAGGASVDLLALSPHSNQLFHRYIAMSGSAFGYYAVRTKTDGARAFQELAKYLGYTGSSPEELLAWYQTIDISKFQQVKDMQRSTAGFLTSVPNFDGDFFPKPLNELRRTAPKIDVIASPEYMDPVKNFPWAINTVYGRELVENPEDVVKKLEHFYTKNIDKTDKTAMSLALINFISDSWFNSAALDTVRSSVKYGNRAYLASFDYFVPKDSEQLKMMAFPAATHGSDMPYILGEAGMGKFEPTEEEFKMMEVMGNMYTNFAKYGNPNGAQGDNSWEPYRLSHPTRYFKIDYPVSKMMDDFQNGRLEIYDEINKTGKKYQAVNYGK